MSEWAGGGGLQVCRAFQRPTRRSVPTRPALQPPGRQAGGRDNPIEAYILPTSLSIAREPVRPIVSLHVEKISSTLGWPS